MSKKTRSLVVLFSLLGGSLVTFLTSPISPVRAEAAETTAVYKITGIDGDFVPLGCTGCPSQKTKVPTFSVQDKVAANIASASEIDTFNVSAWDNTTQTSRAYEGGCAVIFAGLKCWGPNNYGQLGDGSTTTSNSLPVVAKEGSVALTGVTDVSTNGLTTCVVITGALQCIGQGNWPSLKFKRLSTSTTINVQINYAWDNAQYSSTSTNTLQVLNSQNQVIETKGPISSTLPLPEASPFWSRFEELSSGVTKVQVGAVNQSQNGSTPTICVLKADGTSACAIVTSSISTQSSTDVRTSDCDSNSADFETIGEGCTNSGNYRTKAVSVTESNTPPATWVWQDAGVVDAVDIAMPSENWGGSSICFAGTTTVCRTFVNGEFGVKSVAENGENSSSVYITSGWGPPGLCAYAGGTMMCGAGTSNQTGYKMATKLTPVAVMQKPLSVFFGTDQSMQKMYFLLPSGILSADAWILTCSNCQSQSGSVVAPVSAFETSSATDFTYSKSINGSTDSADYIPMTILSGTRKMRSSVAISVRTVAGNNLTGVSIRWNAPDAPGLLTSSSTSTLSSDGSGAARTGLPSGPITFTLSPPGSSTTSMCCTSGPVMITTTTTVPGTLPTTGGTLSNGASLQAASITVLVGDTGAISITVPDPPEIMSRKISVTLPDGTAVPSATVQLKNNYLTYAYQNSGTSTSTWSSRPKDTRGYLGQMNCAYCFVAPPRYATGADGSVTFPSFNPLTRSSAYDADVAYDDGELNQNVKKVFASITETVQMPFMASIKASLPDADPTTATKDADADPSTPETDVKPDANGAVTVDSSLVDEDGAPISELTESVETVNSGCDTGGLVSSSAKVDNICAEGGVATSSMNKAALVRAMGVKKLANCTAVMSAKTNAAGKATLTVCPLVSTKYRIRGKGAVATKTFCVVVNGVKCGIGGGLIAGYTPVATPVATPVYTAPVSAIKISKVKRGKTISFATIKKNSKITVPKGAKVVLVVAAKSKKVCSVKGTTVKGLKAGKCSISVKVTPKKTAKVKKPKTKTTKVTITVSK